MTNLCIKVTVWQRELRKGTFSLHLGKIKVGFCSLIPLVFSIFASSSRELLSGLSKITQSTE